MTGYKNELLGASSKKRILVNCTVGRCWQAPLSPPPIPPCPQGPPLGRIEVVGQRRNPPALQAQLRPWQSLYFVIAPEYLTFAIICKYPDRFVYETLFFLP